MLTWMAYAISVSSVLAIAALCAEHLARRRWAASRWYWLIAITSSLLFPTAMSSISITVPQVFSSTVSQKVVALRQVTSAHLSPLTWIDVTIARSRLETMDAVLKRGWCVASLALSFLLFVSALNLYSRKRKWETGTVAGTAVYISENVGPAVVGLIRPRIVVPTWLAHSSLAQQSAVISHEKSHIAAGDPLLLAICLCLIVLMPWNLPIWWQLRRLRCAIEIDCDARVLKGGQDFTTYGETLIAVGERQSRYIGSVAGMSESRSFLERRLLLMLRKPVKRKLLVAVLLGCMSITLVTLAAQVSPPIMNEASNEHTQVSIAAEVLDRYVGTYKASETTVLKFRREGDHLMSQRTGQGWIGKYPMSDTKFFAKVVEATDRFVVDDSGHVTALVHYQNGREATYPRIDIAEGERIEAILAAKVKSQVATPGTEAALRRNIEGLQSGNPIYSEMSPDLQEATRKQLPDLKEGLNRIGPVKSVQFVGVGNQGWDIYQVTHESGSSTWRVHLADNGIIDGLLVQSGP